MRARRPKTQVELEASIFDRGPELSDGQAEVAHRLENLDDEELRADAERMAETRKRDQSASGTERWMEGLRAERKAVDRTWRYETAPRTGTFCPGCWKPQVYCPSGVTCPNGHGYGEDDLGPRELPDFMRAMNDQAIDGCELTGTHCSDCGEPQIDINVVSRGTLSRTCKNGHDDAASLEETRALPPVLQADVTLSEVKNEVAKVDLPEKKRRRTKRDEPAREDKVRFVATATRGVVVLTNVLTLADVERTRPVVDGAIVKLRPTLKVSERATFDGLAVREKLYELGAARVVLDPRVVPDGKAKVPEVTASTIPCEKRVADWFASVRGATDDEKKSAEAMVLDLLGQVGVV